MPERFSASNAKKHMACHASANLELAIPEYVAPVEDRTANNAANRGTRKHELVEPIMELPASEIRQVAKYLEYVADVRARRRFKVMTEAKVTAEWLSSKPQTTADLVLYTQDEIHILDGKWGKVPVYVHDNAQLLYYAVCFAPLAPRAKGVTLHIMQPALDYYEELFVSAEDLKKFMDEAIATDMAIASGDLSFQPGDHCTFCPANPHSRGQKGSKFCPVLLDIYYPKPFDEDELLNL